MSNVSYNPDFFNLHQERSLSSAQAVIPVVTSFITPSSLIDIGCGNGTWLKAWQESGVEDILGVDGTYVKIKDLLIDKSLFRSVDLEQGYTSDRKYDLVCSLEVAEHIRPPFAGKFIQSLCSLGDVVLFSAAIPGQEGTFHFNEQYPDYWAGLFNDNGFVAIDCIREKIWLNESISWWYRQNILIFVRKEALSKYKELEKEYRDRSGQVMNLVHPGLLQWKHANLEQCRKIIRNPLRILGRYAKMLFGK